MAITNWWGMFSILSIVLMVIGTFAYCHFDESRGL